MGGEALPLPSFCLETLRSYPQTPCSDRWLFLGRKSITKDMRPGEEAKATARSVSLEFRSLRTGPPHPLN